MGQYRPLFVYFSYFLITISIIQIEKSIDVVLGIQTQGRRMVGADKTSELCSKFCLRQHKLAYGQTELICNRVARWFLLTERVLSKQSLMHERLNGCMDNMRSCDRSCLCDGFYCKNMRTWFLLSLSHTHTPTHPHTHTLTHSLTYFETSAIGNWFSIFMQTREKVSSSAQTFFSIRREKVAAR